MPISRSDRDAGFTLVELLVVLAVLGLVTAGGVQMMFRSDPGFATRAAVAGVQATLGQMRGRALGSNRPAAVEFDIADPRYRAGTGAWEPLPDGASLRVVVAGREQQGETRGAIRFYPDGSSSGGTVDISDGIETYRIEVDWLTGRITRQDDAT